MIYCSFTVTFIQYKNDFGLAVAMLYCIVLTISAETCYGWPSLKIIEGSGKLCSSYVTDIVCSKYFVFDHCDFEMVPWLASHTRTKDQGDQRVFNVNDLVGPCFI